MSTAVAKRARDQGGFTLIEVLVATLVLAAILVPLQYAFVFETKQTPIDTSYARMIGRETSSLQLMTQQIRQAYAIESTNGDPTTGQGSYIDFLVMIYNPATGTDSPWEVKYDCGQTSPTNSSYHACVRFACQASVYGQGCTLPTTFPSSGSGVVADLVENAGGSVFTFRDKNANFATNAQDIWSVEANIQVPAGNVTVPGGGALRTGLTHPITLDNQTALPNLQDGT